MARAFHRVLDKKFSLIAAEGDGEADPHYAFNLIQQRAATSSAMRQVQFCMKALWQNFADPEAFIFTRDIAVAYTVAAIGGKAIYEAHRPAEGKMAVGLTKRLARSANAKVVAISQALADYYVQNYEFPSSRVLVAHDGVFPEHYAFLDPKKRDVMRTELGLPTDRILAIHTGSLYKGGGDLFEHLARAGGSELFVVQVGGTRDEQTRWSHYYASRGIENIRFVPHQTPDVARQYQFCADILFYINSRESPIYWCTSPLKLFEYMATGTPILGASIGSVREVLNETNAFCYDPDQPITIANAWHQFRQDPLDAGRRGSLARDQALSRYSWYERARRIVNFASSEEN